MSLVDLVDNSRTDKNTTHCYLSNLYESLMVSKKETATHVLEVGIGPIPGGNGGSIKLWHDYFVNAKVYGLDIVNIDVVPDMLLNNDRIIIHASTDAYDEDFLRTNFIDKEIKFDMVLDDGPHTLDSMKQFIKLYSQVLKDDGMLIIEDVQSWDWIEELKQQVPENLKQFIESYDLRHVKNQYDDIVFVIRKK